MLIPRAERTSWIQLRQIPGLGPVAYLRLLRAFGSAQAVLEQPVERLRQAGLSPALAERLCEHRAKSAREQCEAELARAEAQGVRLVLYSEPDYPVNLKAIYAPPPYLYVRGELRPEDRLAVAIVGTRKATADGIQMAGHLAAALARRGLTIVSGFARGIDSAAHRAALEAGGRTLAVLGSGLEQCYPPENRALFEQVPKQGAIVSELPLEAPPARKNFPPRNRIIAGLTIGVIVVQAPAKSGALISARAAMEQNREVFAVPGPVPSGRFAGCHRLIKDGAALVENEWDVLEALTSEIDQISDEIGLGEEAPLPAERPTAVAALPARPAPLAPPSLSGEERELWNALAEAPTHIDLIARRSGLEIARVSRLLTALQLKQLVGQSAGMLFYKVVSA